MRAALASALLLVVATSAARAQTVDLRKANGYRPAVGDRVKSTKSDRQVMDMEVLQAGTNPLQQKHEEQGFEGVWVDEVQAVGEDGKKPTRFLRTYERFKDLRRGEELPVEGVKVLYSTDAAGTRSFTAAEGSAPIPAALERRLHDEADKQTAKARAGADKEDVKEVLLPAEPQAVGATWSVEPARVATNMDLGKPEDLVADKSSVTGTLVGVEEKDGTSWATVRVAVKLSFLRLKDLPCAEPALLDMSIELVVPVAGDSPAGSMTARATFDAKPTPPNLPKDVTMTMNMTMDGAEKRERQGP
jgi:hypothetical protein